MHLEGRGVHGDEHVRDVARRVDVLAGEAHLEGADAGERALGCPDLGRDLRHGADIVAENGCCLGELGAGQLHAVTRVTGEAYGYAIDINYFRVTLLSA